MDRPRGAGQVYTGTAGQDGQGRPSKAALSSVDEKSWLPVGCLDVQAAVLAAPCYKWMLHDGSMSVCGCVVVCFFFLNAARIRGV